MSALERIRVELGAYPAAFDGLAPAYLDQLPVDVAFGEPFRYVRDGAVEDGGPRLYSVGMDGVDNGGRHRTDAFWRRRTQSKGGDYVLYPAGRADVPDDE